MTAIRSATLATVVLCLVTLALPAQGGAAGKKKKRLPEKEIAAAAAALVSADEGQALAAATLLGEAGNSTATTPLIEALALGLSPTVALGALRALEARGDAAGLETLEAYLKVRSKTLRAAAVRAAAAVGSSKGDALVAIGLTDPTREVRAVASEMVVTRKLKSAAPTLLGLLSNGEMTAATALGTIADAEIARAVAETIGNASDKAVAQALGTMLLRADFGPDSLRVEVVRALAKVPKGAGAAHLASYVAATPEKPPRESRRIAEELLEDTL